MEKLSKRKTTMLILAMLFIGLCAFALATTKVASADETGTFAGGSGTEADPYIIETAAQLDAVRNNLSASYRLNADIAFTEADFAEGGAFYNDGIGWVPIGTYSDAFKGTFDGNGHVIRNLQCGNSSYSGTVGLFCCSRGTIKRLGMVNCRLEGGNAGSICYDNEGSISECYNTGIVRADDAGGITCYNRGTIENCYNSGEIGRPNEGYSSMMGGITGVNGCRGKILNCYNVGLVKYASEQGAIAGYCVDSATVQDCYYLNYGHKACGNRDDETGALSLEQMKLQASYGGFDFDGTWTIDPNTDYCMPTLKNVVNYAVTLKENTTDYAGGYGTYDSPYLIKTKQQLDNVRKNLWASYRLENDIVFETTDFSKKGAFYNEGKRWEPIGTSENPFYGNFDGNKHCISGIVVDRSDEYCAGMFSNNYGTICSLEISDFKIKAQTYAGGIVANNNGNINGCFNRSCANRIEATWTGLFSASNNGTGVISKCYNTGDVNIYANFAVFSNYNSTNASIDKCYNSGNINGNYDAAGIVGDNYGSVTDCYNTGDIVGKVFVGGVAIISYGGIDGWDYKGVVENCYNIGTIVTKTNAYSEHYGKTYVAGGILGNSRTTNLKNCYSIDSNYNYITGDGYGTFCSIGKMASKNTYAGFDFDNVWEFDSEDGYTFPTLRGVKNYATAPTENTTDFAGGYGTKSSPYIIENKTQLNNVRKKLNACYKLNADISFSSADFASGGTFYSEGKGWEPIGNEEDLFAGSFNGNGHSISGLTINRGSEENIGLFGVSCGTVMKLNMSDCAVIGKTKVGCVVGYNSTGKILRCSNTGIVTAYVDKDNNYNKYAYAGGITGYSEDGNIEDCSNGAMVKVGCYERCAYAGGITGFNGAIWYSKQSKITRCNNYGEIMDFLQDDSTGSIHIAGIVGNNSGTIDSCWNIGKITGLDTRETAAGGIAGDSRHGTITGSYNAGAVSSKYCSGGILADNSESSDINGCYNVGKITTTAVWEYEGENENAFAGGIIGYTGYMEGLKECYNLGEVSSNSGNVGGIVGSVTSDRLIITTCYNAGQVSCTSGNVGGIAGESESEFSNCFYLDNVEQAVGSGTGTATKCAAAQMQDAETYGDAFDFDYDMIWEISDTAEYKYPILTEVVNPELQYTLTTGTKQGMPAAPVAASYGNGKITIAAVSGQKYVCVPDTDTGYSGEIPAFSSSEWKSASGAALVFSELEEGKTYKVYTYIPASGSKSASYVSQPLVITLKAVGDLTGDGKIDSSDALYLRRALAGWDGYELNFSAADINGDGKLNVNDIMCLERHIAGWQGYKTLPVTTEPQAS